MTTAWSMKLQPWWFWGQRWDTSPEPDPNRFENCGPECIAMCVMHWAEQEVQAAVINDYMVARNWKLPSGGTNLVGMVEYLQVYAGCPGAHYVQFAQSDVGKAGFLYTIWKQLSSNRPVIAIRGFESPTGPNGHYGVVMGMNSYGRIYEADPWEGHMKDWSWDDYWKWSYNYLILPHRARSISR